MADNLYGVTPLEGEQFIHLPLEGGHTLIVDNEGWGKVLRLPALEVEEGGNTFYATYDDERGHTNYLHRTLMGNPAKGLHVDHINGNGLDNTYCNLRVATPAQNLANSRLSRSSTTGFKGATFSKRDRRYVARLARREVARCAEVKDAARAYDVALLDAFGPFALTNAKLGLL